MANLSMMRANLQQMRGQLLPLMDALFKGTPDEVRERNRRLTDLEAIQRRLAIVIRDINNAQHLEQARESGIHNLPRDARYSAAQGIQQRQNDLAALRKEAEDLAVVVRNLLEANGFLSPVQKAMKMNELIENFMKAAENQHALSELGMPNGPVITNVHETASMSGLVPVILFVYLAIQKFRKKSSDSAGPKRR